MDRFMKGIEKFLMPAANMIQKNKILQCISQGLMSTMSIMMIGAFASILQGLPIDAYQTFLIDSHLNTILQNLVNISTNMLALYVSFAVAYSYIKRTAYDPFAAGLISIASFLIVTPFVTTGEGYMAVTNLPLNWLGSQGIFTAMIIGVISALIYQWFNQKNFVIKMPEGVPEFVSRSFSGILPGLSIVVIFAALSYAVTFTQYESIHALIYGLIQVPLSNIGTSIWAALLIYILSGLCWFFGIHGIAVMTVIMPVWAAADAENMSLIAAGVANADLPNIITYNWVNAVATIGGAGCTIGLVFWMSLKGKSERYKALGRLALVPGVFNINEPVVFGAPCVLNPILAIPFIFLPCIFIAIAYGLVLAGILPISNGIGAPMGTPLILQGIFNGGWRLAVFQAFAILVSIIVYYPFFKILDKKAVEEETAQPSE